MEIGSVIGGGAGQGALTGSAGSVLGKDEFLTLFLTQLQMQDPFKPMENEEMIAQLAQFSSLEQLQNMNDGFEGSLEADLMVGQLLNNTMATTMIGRSVRAGGNSFQLGSEGDVELSYELSAPAAEVNAAIYDGSGNLITSVNGLSPEEGNHSFRWDGDSPSGGRLPQGGYTFRVTALDESGNEIASEEFLTGEVEGVRYIDGNAVLVAGNQEIALGDVREVFDRGEE